jgi:hypothetical protein
MKDYLTIMIDSNLLQYDIDSRKFRITEKGLSCLQLCDQIGDLLEEEQQQQQRWWLVPETFAKSTLARTAIEDCSKHKHVRDLIIVSIL